MTTLVVGLALFLGVHLVPSAPPLRLALIAQLGERRYKGAFALAALLGLALIIAGYAASGAQERLFAPTPWARAIAPYAMIPAFVLFAAANMRTHIRRSVHHPMLLGLLIWALVHLFANGEAKGTLLFGAFAAYGVFDLISATERGTTKSFAPEMKHDVIALVAGTVLALIVMASHRVLFGVAAVPFGL